MRIALAFGAWCRTPGHGGEAAKHPRPAKPGALKTAANSFGTSFLAALSLIACAGGAEDEVEIDPILIADMQIGLSTDGSEGFSMAEDGADVQLASGAQGGYHVWTAPRFRGAAGTLYLDREARRVSDGTLMLRASRLVIDVPVNAMSDWWREQEAIPSFMCPAPVGLRAFDTEVEFTFTLYNEEEELLAIDSLIVVPRCPTGEAGEHCRDVCAG